MANERLDIVIFGATGFTGKYAVKVAAELAKEKQIKFGVSGRRKQALEAIVKEYAPDIDNVPIIIADLKDEESLRKMTEQAKLLVNCVGPYRFYGEPVIKACIATHTHQLDVTAEQEYMEHIRMKYDKAAQEAGIYIISACGLDCIPTDLGVVFTQQKFEGEINSVETYLSIWLSEKKLGPVLHYGTYESAVYVIGNYAEINKLQKQQSEKLPNLAPKLKKRSFLHRRPVKPAGWSAPFPGADRSVALHTQQFFYEKYKQRPAQIETYITAQSLFEAVAAIFLGLIFYVLASFRFGRNVLLKYPTFFSGGYISREDPKPEDLDHTHFCVTCVARGWSEKLAEPTDEHKEPPTKVVITNVSGDNGYYATCIMLLLSAITLLKESDKIPVNGGVLSPGAAFGKTSLIEELNKKNIKFQLHSLIAECNA